MTLIERLTPQNTEELRPGIFVQARTKNPNSISYHVVNPIAWNGEWRLNKQIGWKNLITILIILFIAWTYFNETEFCRQLQEDPCEVLPNITAYCSERNSIIPGVNYEQGNTITIQDYP